MGDADLFLRLIPPPQSDVFLSQIVPIISSTFLTYFPDNLNYRPKKKKIIQKYHVLYSKFEEIWLFRNFWCPNCAYSVLFSNGLFRLISLEYTSLLSVNTSTNSKIALFIGEFWGNLTFFCYFLCINCAYNGRKKRL